MAKGIIVEYDFAAMDGAELLFNTATKFLKDLDGIAFDSVIEARHFAGGNYQGCFEEYFPIVKTKKTALKAGRDFDAAVRQAFTAALATPPGAAFVNFVSTLAAKNVKVVISTRADIENEGVRNAFAALLGPNCELNNEESTTYGSVKWDAWRRACARTSIKPYNAVAVTGSGYGVKAALRAGIASVAVMNPRNAYQDYSGCDEFVKALDTAAAKKCLEILRI